MKTSIPKIGLITPKKFEMTDVRAHLSRATDEAFRYLNNPVIAFGIVMFHEDGQHTSSWHQTNLRTNGLDFCDMVRNRLKASVQKQ